MCPPCSGWKTERLCSRFRGGLEDFPSGFAYVFSFSHKHHRPTAAEDIFFDLVFVAAIAQVRSSFLLLLSLTGGTAGLLFPVGASSGAFLPCWLFVFLEVEASWLFVLFFFFLFLLAPSSTHGTTWWSTPTALAVSGSTC